MLINMLDIKYRGLLSGSHWSKLTLLKCRTFLLPQLYCPNIFFTFVMYLFALKTFFIWDFILHAASNFIGLARWPSHKCYCTVALLSKHLGTVKRLAYRWFGYEWIHVFEVLCVRDYLGIDLKVTVQIHCIPCYSIQRNSHKYLMHDFLNIIIFPYRVFKIIIRLVFLNYTLADPNLPALPRSALGLLNKYIGRYNM